MIYHRLDLELEQRHSACLTDLKLVRHDLIHGLFMVSCFALAFKKLLISLWKPLIDLSHDRLHGGQECSFNLVFISDILHSRVHVLKHAVMHKM